MRELLWLIPALPCAGFFILTLAGARLSHRGVALIGAGSVGLAALLSALVGLAFITAPPSSYAYVQTLWTWLEVSGLQPGIAFHLDPLALVMITVITAVGFLIHLYAVTYMGEEEGYGRFFAYMNLFVGAMLTLVLADNLLLLYLGWEGVGLCSYLLIGFWYRDPVSGYAARKAFVVTRVGDVALALGILLLATQVGTLHIQDLLRETARQWPDGSPLATLAAFLILGGALGKSAQLPLQTWLPDAMAGPVPVSALIHAATMVTAGVYLIARLQGLFTLAPAAQGAVAAIGAATLLLAGCSALVQRDIKRILAYSTISQIGYMFLALGVGAWSAAIFHFLTHAFFKALLFLGAGAVMLGLNHERDIYRMGGLRTRLPLTFWTFLVGAASLSAFPLVTAGFYSKEFILAQAWQSGGPWLWAAGIAGAFLTSLYAFRMVFLVFCGPAKGDVSLAPSLCRDIPLLVLALLAIVSGFLETPRTLGGLSLLTDFLRTGGPASLPELSLEVRLQLIASLASLAGIYTAYLFFRKRPRLAEEPQSAVVRLLHRFWFSGWGFDWLYHALLVQPFLWLAKINRDDFLDLIYRATAWCAAASHRALSRTQTGQVRWYAAVIAGGTVALVALAVFL